MIPLFDAHCDTLSRLYESGGCLRANDGHFDLNRSSGFRPAAQFFAVYGQTFETLYPFFHQCVSENNDRMVLCRRAEDASAAADAGKLAAFLSLEGGETVNCSPEELEQAFLKGARMVSLTWNHDNALAGGVGGAGTVGLTEAGRLFLQKARSLSMIVDVSHLSDKSFWDVAEAMAGEPFVASHSNARAVHPHRRNLTDEQFVTIVRANGFAGINLYSAFLAPDPVTKEHVFAHIEHFLALGGQENIGFGCDFDGCESLPIDTLGVQSMSSLYELLLRYNYRESLVQDIFYNNLMRIVKTICGMSVQEIKA